MRWVVICAEPIIDVDTTAADFLAELIEQLRERDIVIVFAELKHPVEFHLERYGLVCGVGCPELYPTIGSAVHAYIEATGVDWVDWEDAEPEVVQAADAGDAHETEGDAGVEPPN